MSSVSRCLGFGINVRPLASIDSSCWDNVYDERLTTELEIRSLYSLSLFCLTYCLCLSL